MLSPTFTGGATNFPPAVRYVAADASTARAEAGAIGGGASGRPTRKEVELLADVLRLEVAAVDLDLGFGLVGLRDDPDDDGTDHVGRCSRRRVEAERAHVPDHAFG